MSGLLIEALSQEKVIAEGVASAAPLAVWLRRPLDVKQFHSAKEYATAVNNFFEECADKEEQPRLSGLALALGLSGPSELARLARRREDLRWMISRALTVVSYWYEKQIGNGNSAGAIFMLKNLPDFDMEEPAGSPELHYYKDRKESFVQLEAIVGVEDPNKKDSNLSPIDAYLKVVQGGEVYELGQDAETKAEQDAKAAEDDGFEFQKALKELAKRHKEKVSQVEIVADEDIKNDYSA